MTAPLDPYHPFDTPIVRTAEFTYFQKGQEVKPGQRVYRDAVPNKESYPRNADDTTRQSKPKQNVDARAFTQTPLPQASTVFVRGFVRRKDSSKPLQNIRLAVQEWQFGAADGGVVDVRPDGTFILFGLPIQHPEKPFGDKEATLPPKNYTLVVSAEGIDKQTHTFTLPLPDPNSEVKIEL
jgi:hypothetical protein